MVFCDDCRQYISTDAFTHVESHRSRYYIYSQKEKEKYCWFVLAEGVRRYAGLGAVSERYVIIRRARSFT